MLLGDVLLLKWAVYKLWVSFCRTLKAYYKRSLWISSGIVIHALWAARLNCLYNQRSEVSCFAKSRKGPVPTNFFFFFFFGLFVFSRAAPKAYGGSQARGLIGAVATSLSHSHSNAESEPHLQPIPQLTATPDT